MHKSENDTKCKEIGKKLMLSYKINTIKCTTNSLSLYGRECSVRMRCLEDKISISFHTHAHIFT